MNRLSMMFGGRIAEEIFFKDVSAGAKDDIQKATQLARMMVCEWGMSDKMGPISYMDNEETMFLGREIQKTRNLSEATQWDIDQEIRKIVDEAYVHARTLISENREKLETISELLIKYETLTGEDVNRILRGEDIVPEKEGELAREEERVKKSNSPEDPKTDWNPGENSLAGPQQA